jgi:hypothetical protein
MRWVLCFGDLLNFSCYYGYLLKGFDEMSLFVLFIVCNIANVIIQTIKSICTIKCGKTAAAVVNALAYGFYTYIIVLTTCELSLLTKCIVVGLCNLVGVYVVKYFEEKSRKDKLWKVEVTVPTEYKEIVDKLEVTHSYIVLSDKHTLFNFYCETQEESLIVKNAVENYNAKYFVAESKVL